MNILVVDDNSTNRKLVRATLEAEKHQCFEAADGLEALVLLQQHPITLIISDILMPNMDGYRLCHEVRQSKQWRDIPVIVYSSTYTSPADEKLAMDFGADKFLRKPSSAQTILDALQEVAALIGPHRPPGKLAIDQLKVMKEYSERLVAKLEEKNAELHRRSESLEQGEKRYRDLVELSPDAIFIECEGKLVFMNKRAARLFGAPDPNALIGTPVVQSFHPSCRKFLKGLLKELEQPDHTLAAQEMELLRADGSVCEAELAAASLTFDGKPASQIVIRDISERKAAQRTAQESQERFRQLAETINEVFWLSDKRLSKMLYVSPAFQRIWGRSCDSLIQEPLSLFQAAHADDRERVIASLQRQKAGEATIEEFRIVRPDGSVRWVCAHTYPVLNAEGEFYRTAGIASDITGRKEAESQLLLQATALNTAANAILITDRKGIIQWVNPAFTVVTGYSEEEAIGKTPRLLKSGRHDAAFYRDFWKAITSGQTWRSEFVNRRKDGALYYDEHTVTPVRSQGGDITHFIGVLHDITARKRAEEELRATHEKLQHLLTHSPAVLYALKLEGRKVVPHVVSENINVLLGFEVEETLQYEWWVGQLHPEDRDAAIDSISETLEQAESRTEYRIRRKDGGYRWVEDNRRMIPDSSGQPKEIVGVWTDITERKKLEEEVALREQRLNAFFTGATAGLALLDRDLRFIQINATLAEMNGMAASAHIGRTVQEIVPQLAPTVVPILQKVLATGEAILNVELAGETSQQPGTRRHWMESFFPIAGKGGKPEAVGAIVVEVTERKRAEEARQESERRFREMLENVELIAMTLDKNGIMTFCNEYLLRLTGWKREEVIGKDYFATFIHEKNAEARKLFFDTIDTGAIPSHYQNPIKTRDGELREIVWNNTVLRDAAGNILGTASIAEDVTDRKRSEEELMRFNRAAVGRELRMVELKQKVNELCQRLGEPPRHNLAFLSQETSVIGNCNGSHPGSREESLSDKQSKHP